MNEPQATAQIYVPTLMEKIGWKLFPSKIPDDPDPESKARDMIVTRTTINFSFADRLRILVSGRVEVESRTATENEIGGHRTTACSSVRPPKLLTRNGAP